MNESTSGTPTVDQEGLKWARGQQKTDETLDREFGTWVLRSPEHLSVFFKHKMLGTELASLDPNRTVDVESLLARAKENTKVVHWPGRAAAGQPSQETPADPGAASAAGAKAPWGWLAAGIATLTVSIGAGGWYGLLSFPHSNVYATNTGQQRNLVLNDGSTIELNTESSVRVEYSKAARNVYLLRGEALFDVKHNAAVPFRVHANGTLIEDLGTQFTVHRRSDATTVSVIEGVVQVSTEESVPPPPMGKPDHFPDLVVTTKEFQPLRKPARLSAGEQASIVAEGTLMQRRPANIPQATAWRHGRVAFLGSTLEEIITEFNRYNLRKIQIHGESLRERRFSGVFDARDPESFIDFLREDKGIEIEDNKEGMVLRRH